MNNSSDAAELDMLRKLSGDKTLFLSGKADADLISASAVPGMPGAWFLTDLTQPGYFALKFGTGGTNATATTFFFRNTGNLSQLVWTDDQVQFLTGGACANNQSKCNIGRLSHYTTTMGVSYNQVELPEPGGIVLLGLGLLAATGARRRRG
ncbi:PEP-CTERM sorting domain-containing protein [Massilia sp. IC2-476]|uniref:PEP-CTERM sorting domain-containing protein n=1 Tax=Massilia sp. IC2-476 TaxID=2887199 RepID=UPI001D10326A|nr:PEP-CTERM sorting domain-containing protein [Massilia sp. IC2-476]MCC2972026.1 PEP-CTERM sorting domain-containing protein [Massilia sp. IC2-476]